MGGGCDCDRREDCNWNREGLVPVREAGRSDVGDGEWSGAGSRLRASGGLREGPSASRLGLGGSGAFRP